ncbi:MAG TPA: hypothetical protein VG797_05820 [Phycisphaerales bacterium]|nr:hypothetical protein [Phycisphaerales bacterium]
MHAWNANDPPGVTPDQRQDIMEYVETAVRAGYESDRDIASAACSNYVELSIDQRIFESWIQSLVKESVARIRAESRTWPAMTDCDRLDAAFAELERDGYIARQNYSCCQTCGIAEICQEAEDLTAQGRSVVGYVFFHEQDTENAVDGIGLCLAFGSDSNDPETDRRVAQHIIFVLDRHGLQTSWPGTIDKRIVVEIDWKRRRPEGGMIE